VPISSRSYTPVFPPPPNEAPFPFSSFLELQNYAQSSFPSCSKFSDPPAGFFFPLSIRTSRIRWRPNDAEPSKDSHISLHPSLLEVAALIRNVLRFSMFALPSVSWFPVLLHGRWTVHKYEFYFSLKCCPPSTPSFRVFESDPPSGYKELPLLPPKAGLCSFFFGKFPFSSHFRPGS